MSTFIPVLSLSMSLMRSSQVEERLGGGRGALMEKNKPGGAFVTLCEASPLYASQDLSSFSCCHCPWALVHGCQGLLWLSRIWHVLNMAHCLHANGALKPS